MQCRMDKRVIELLNEDGVEITWEQFRAAYDRRRNERNADLFEACSSCQQVAEDLALEAFLDRFRAPRGEAGNSVAPAGFTSWGDACMAHLLPLQ